MILEKNVDNPQFFYIILQADAYYVLDHLKFKSETLYELHVWPGIPGVKGLIGTLQELIDDAIKLVKKVLVHIE